jgi:hypothetical protein
MIVLWCYSVKEVGLMDSISISSSIIIKSISISISISFNSISISINSISISFNSISRLVLKDIYIYIYI